MKKKLLSAALQLFLWRVALWWCKSLKIITVNAEQVERLQDNEKNYVAAFWHGAMLVGWFMNRPKKRQTVSALVSQSEDGEDLSTILEKWKYTMIRGSSHIGGKEAMQLMVDEITKGSSLAITPDGPRGPRYEMKMGAIRAAQKTNVPLILVGIASKKKKSLRSWDKFEVSMPFSKVVAKYSDPIYVPKELNGEPLDEFRNQIQVRFLQLTEEAEQMLHKEGSPA